MVEGQVQGSLANGLGQALTENAVYDPASGQLVTGSFMDYGMPRAHDMPLELREATHVVPATTNPLGVKGTGEAGTTAAIAAVMNAISNAVPNGAADHMEMPATPSKVWEAVQKGMAAGSRRVRCPGCGATLCACTAPGTRACHLSLRDELRVHIRLQTLDAAFRAVARLLDAAERRFRRRNGDRVDADHAGLNRLADRLRLSTSMPVKA